MKNNVYRLAVGITAVWMSLALCGCGEEPAVPAESAESAESVESIDPVESTASTASTTSASTVDQGIVSTTKAAEPQAPSKSETTTKTTTTTATTTAKSINPTTTKTTTMPIETTTTTAAKQNEVGQAKTKDEFTVTLTSFRKVDDSYVAELIVACDASALDDHELLAKERLWIVDATKHRTGITAIVDDGGESLMGKTLPKGGTQYMKVTFKPESGFIPVTFSYVYDTRGFREIRFAL